MKFVTLVFKRCCWITIIFIYRKRQKAAMKHTLLAIVLVLLLTLSVVADDGSDAHDDDTSGSSGSSDSSDSDDREDSESSGSNDEEGSDSGLSDDYKEEVRIKTADGEYREKTEVKDGVIRTETKIRTADTELESRTKLASDSYEDRTRLKTRTELLEDGVFMRLEEEQRVRLHSLDAEELRRLAHVDGARLAILAQLSEGDLQKVSNLDQAELRELAQHSPEDIRERLRMVEVIEGDEDYRIRSVTETRIRTSIDRLTTVQKQRVELHTHYDESVEELREQRDRLRECDTDCDELRNETLQHAKDVALHMVERLVNKLDGIEARIQAAEDLPEEDATLRLKAIAALKAEAADINADIEAATTTEELREAVADLRALIQKIKRGIFSHAHALLRAHAVGLINRGEILERKMTCSLDGLAEAGVNTTEVDAKVETYDSLMAEARLKMHTAAETYDRADREAIEATKELLKEARDLIEEAQQLAVEIRADIRLLGGEACTAPRVAIDESVIDLDAAEVREESEDDDTDEPEDESESEEVQLSAEAQAIISDLETLLSSTNTTANLKVSYEKEGEVEVEEEVEGELTTEQQVLWDELKAELLALVEAKEGHARLEVEIESESDDEDEHEDDDESEDDSLGLTVNASAEVDAEVLQ